MSPPSQRAHRAREARGVLRSDPGEARARRARPARNARSCGCSWCCILIALAGLARLQVGNSLGAQFFERNAPVHGFRMADARLAGTRVIQVLVEGNAPDAIKNPEVLRRMDELGDVHHPPAAARRQGRVDRRPAQADEPGHGPVAGGGKLPDTTQGVAQYLLLYAMGGEEEDLARLVDRDFQRAVITAYLKTDDFRAMKAMTERRPRRRPIACSRACPRRRASAAASPTPSRSTRRWCAGKTMNLIQISLLVLVITSLLLRSIVGRLSGAAAARDRGAREPGPDGLDGDPAVDGDGRDLGDGDRHRRGLRRLLHLPRARGVRAHRRSAPGDGDRADHVGKAIAYVASAVAGGYLCLALSLFKVHVLLGVLVALTMVTSSAATVAFLPSVILLVKPRFLHADAGNDLLSRVRRAEAAGPLSPRERARGLRVRGLRTRDALRSAGLEDRHVPGGGVAAVAALQADQPGAGVGRRPGRRHRCSSRSVVKSRTDPMSMLRAVVLRSRSGRDPETSSRARRAFRVKCPTIALVTLSLRSGKAAPSALVVIMDQSSIRFGVPPGTPVIVRFRRLT